VLAAKNRWLFIAFLVALCALAVIVRHRLNTPALGSLSARGWGFSEDRAPAFLASQRYEVTFDAHGTIIGEKGRKMELARLFIRLRHDNRALLVSVEPLQRLRAEPWFETIGVLANISTRRTAPNSWVAEIVPLDPVPLSPLSNEPLQVRMVLTP
jgi:hypothetical protein